ncbi:MAG: MarR family transcriptional regulator [Bacteroidota bacterium]
MTLGELIQQSRFSSPSQEALLNVLATASYITSEMGSTLADSGVTQAQYNVLRILRGGHPEPYACSEIAGRLLDRTPDVTRLLVRLERQGLVRRQRAEHDRRVVEVEITEAGLELLETLDAPVSDTLERLTAHLDDAELQAISTLLERVRTDQA